MTEPARSVADLLDPGRRAFLGRTAAGLGTIALSALLAEEGVAALRRGAEAQEDPFAVKPPHFAAKAKRVIWLFMDGAPSQIDLFEDKPKLRELHGKPVPAELIAGERFAFISGTPNLLAPRHPLRRHGKSGAVLSDLLPRLAGVADRLAFVKSMHTNEINHVPAALLLNTGSPRQGRPAMGSWLGWGLGSEAKDLPGFVVLASGKASRCGGTCWQSGFLPSVYQGVPFRGAADPVLHLGDPPGMDRALRRKALDALQELNRENLERAGDPEIATRIAAYEMAYRMQASVPGLADLATEPREALELYGAEPGKPSFAANCLLARRLVEKGVRFVQLVHGGWDHHGGDGDQNLVTGLPERCLQTDRAAAALIEDLARRGLLDSTLVVWGAEFGRTPMIQGDATNPEVLGRDHQKTAFTLWLAGGGIRPGITLGATDELGIRITEDPVHVHDLQATVLHLLGLDHTRLTFRHSGRDFRLTDVSGQVVTKLLA